MFSENPTKYTSQDPWVWCKNCRALLQVDPMDSSCRLCHEFNVLSQDAGNEVIKTFSSNKKYIQVGSFIPGYADGYFGRDSYENKRIITVGPTYVVALDDNENVHVAQGENIIEKLEDYMRRLMVGK